MNYLYKKEKKDGKSVVGVYRGDRICGYIYPENAPSIEEKSRYVFENTHGEKASMGVMITGAKRYIMAEYLFTFKEEKYVLKEVGLQSFLAFHLKGRFGSENIKIMQKVMSLYITCGMRPIVKFEVSAIPWESEIEFFTGVSEESKEFFLSVLAPFMYSYYKKEENWEVYFYGGN